MKNVLIFGLLIAIQFYFAEWKYSIQRLEKLHQDQMYTQGRIQYARKSALDARKQLPSTRETLNHLYKEHGIDPDVRIAAAALLNSTLGTGLKCYKAIELDNYVTLELSGTTAQLNAWLEKFDSIGFEATIDYLSIVRGQRNDTFWCVAIIAPLPLPAEARER